MKTNNIKTEKCNVEFLQSKLKDLFKGRDTLIQSQNINDIINNGLKIVRKMLKTQTASIFILSKEGVLERKGIYGVDKNNNFIKTTWFSDEHYDIGESITGRAALPTNDSGLGEPQWLNNLQQEYVKGTSYTKYLDKLGNLECVISVPLNGQYQTFGVLEVINKVEKQDIVDKTCGFTKEDVYWLSNLGANIATALTNAKKVYRLKILTRISEKLTDSFKKSFDLKKCLRFIAKAIVSEYTNYKACIIRLDDGSETDGIEILEGKKITKDNFIYKPFIKGEEIAGIVYKTGKDVIIEDISKKRKKFVNIEWIESNNLKSYLIT